MTPWIFTAEPVDSPDAYALRRGYYAEVAGRYWKRSATPDEVDQGLAGDGAELLVAPTGHFVIGRYEGEAAACGGLLILNSERAELARVYVRPARRGSGGADLLLATLEHQARVLGMCEMVLNTRLDLIEARSLYRRHGYVEIPAYCVSPPYVDVWYGKDLTVDASANSPAPTQSASFGGRCREARRSGCVGGSR
jgi:GNAT superfamily N-acetyltransferase